MTKSALLASTGLWAYGLLMAGCVEPAGPADALPPTLDMSKPGNFHRVAVGESFHVHCLMADESGLELGLIDITKHSNLELPPVINAAPIFFSKLEVPFFARPTEDSIHTDIVVPADAQAGLYKVQVRAQDSRGNVHDFETSPGEEADMVITHPDAPQLEGLGTALSFSRDAPLSVMATLTDPTRTNALRAAALRIYQSDVVTDQSGGHSHRVFHVDGPQLNLVAEQEYALAGVSSLDLSTLDTGQLLIDQAVEGPFVLVIQGRGAHGHHSYHRVALVEYSN